MLSACSPAPEGLSHLHDYQQRVANTLNQPAVNYQPVPRIQPPSARDLRLLIERIEISLLDAMRLDACAAGPLIAERNSSLGRLQQGVLRYFYDRQLTEALQLCAKQLHNENPELAKRVQQQAEAKRKLMPQLRTQAITQDYAIRNIISMADRPLAKPDSSTLAPLFSAMNTLLQVLDDQAPLPTEPELIAALERLDKDAYIAQLWRALHDNHAYIQQLEPLVSNLSHNAGCLSAGVPKRAQVLRQVFIARFSGPVQRHLNALTHQAAQLEPYIQALDTPLPAWQTHLRHIVALDDQVKAITRNHVQYWQQFFRDCEFTPGA
ncbi:Protein of unknown function (DUF3080) [Pseudidiomarina woesei]|uniref:DUF3080 domain-containing protein n=2 Tax=Pseudidiomarina woesei TaxID=1381080 RepID=A0A0K6GV72_9GAMM|nr:Protein of unknown function (DUF3080) [Pseudidiomarina woesei]